jgi:hypothetical protein
LEKSGFIFKLHEEKIQPVMEVQGQQHVADKPPEIISYYTMRKAIGILGIVFPIILLAGSFLFGECHKVQISISAYYHTNMRNIFVGLNCAVALFLFSYRGHDRIDNMAGYLGCIFALGVAFLPCRISHPDPPCLNPSFQDALIGKLHLACAGLFFLVLIVYTLFQFPKTHTDLSTGENLPMGPQKKKRNKVYYLCGSTMVLSLILMILYLKVLEHRYPRLDRMTPVFWLESVSLLCFGFSWLTKGQLFFRDP